MFKNFLKAIEVGFAEERQRLLGSGSGIPQPSYNPHSQPQFRAQAPTPQQQAQEEYLKMMIINGFKDCQNAVIELKNCSINPGTIQACLEAEKEMKRLWRSLSGL